MATDWNTDWNVALLVIEPKPQTRKHNTHSVCGQRDAIVYEYTPRRYGDSDQYHGTRGETSFFAGI